MQDKIEMNVDYKIKFERKKKYNLLRYDGKFKPSSMKKKQNGKIKILKNNQIEGIFNENYFTGSNIEEKIQSFVLIWNHEKKEFNLEEVTNSYLLRKQEPKKEEVVKQQQTISPPSKILEIGKKEQVIKQIEKEVIPQSPGAPKPLINPQLTPIDSSESESESEDSEDSE